MKAIAAVSRDGVIGVGGRLPWHVSSEMNYFKKKTWNDTIIMGRITKDSIGKPLRNRQNVVLTRQNKGCNGFVYCNSTEEAVDRYKDAWVIGGAQVYNELLPYCNELHLSVIPVDITPGKFRGEFTSFPLHHLADFERVETTFADEYTVHVYKRK